MTPVRQVVLVLSPRAAKLVQNSLAGARGQAADDDDIGMGICMEIDSQLGERPIESPPPLAQQVADRMAKAAAKAREETPEQRRTRILWAQDAKP